nr:HAD family hydrolase [uncultured Mediterraneibacter sp.]
MSNKYETAIFDLDGTITDSGPGIMNSIRYALKKSGIAEPTEEVLRTFIGPPLHRQFQDVFHLSEEEGDMMVSMYREYYSEKGIFENSVYKGIPETLKQLKRTGIKILMATSKPEEFAKRIAEHFDFGKYFDFIGGACMDGSRTDKYEVIEYVMESCNISESGRKRAIMIGDRKHDILGAKKAGIRSIGVLYGYGSREELESAGANVIAATPKEICEYFVQ